MRLPLQNRVTPAGDIIAVPERGLLMGNRGGRLHRPDKTLTRRRWTSRAWIACALEFKGWREPIMAPNRYTQLFFLDEATAFAAGHRPCALCRRLDYLNFAAAFSIHQGAPGRLAAAAIDRVLHAERLTPARQKQTHTARLADLPDGAMVQMAGAARLLWRNRLRPWTPGGYRSGGATDTCGLLRTDKVDVLTPPSIVAVLKLGYRPMVHPTADAEVA